MFTFDIGQVVGSAVSAYQANKAQKRQMAWERERATHAHQWEVQDLINAGLNPILSAGGSGAVTGGVSAPTMDATGIMNALSSKQEQKESKSREKLNTANTLKSESETELNQANKDLAELQQIETAEQARKAKIEADRAQTEYDTIKPLLETDRKYNASDTGQALHMINRGWGDTGGVVTTVGLGALGGVKLLGSKQTAKQALQQAKSKAFADKIMKDTGKIPLTMAHYR